MDFRETAEMSYREKGIPEDIPGQILSINTETGVGALIEPLHGNPDIAAKIEAQGMRLRLNEALALDWVDDSKLCVDFSGKRPMFRFQPDSQKSNKAELLPMAHEFAEFLSQTPSVDRDGFVFTPQPQRAYLPRMHLDSASKVITRIGKAAGVKVSESRKGKVKYASAHDLRRSFGFRGSNLVMPAILQQLMRYASIVTTMEYYVGRNAETTADVLWEVVSNTSANTGDISADTTVKSQPQTIDGTGFNK